MNREIKFRAWDNERKEMIDYISSISPVSHNLLNISISNHIVMQYTGLKDKNGVEIYEGDLIRTYHIKGEVIEHSGSFGIMQNPQDFLSLYNILDRGDFHKVEIIGNIYENPNLITN